MRARDVLSAVALVLATGACATVGRPSSGIGPEARTVRAMEALEREAFATARYELQALVADCASGSRGRDALLLLAAAELDTANPDRSPRRAAHLAGAYLLLPDAAPEALPLARALYRLGTELTVPAASPRDPGLMPAVATRFDTCDPTRAAVATRALPDVSPSRAGRLASFEAELSARGDSLANLRSELSSRTAEVARLRARVGGLRAEVAELEAEIARITELLKSGLDAYTRHRR